jgi:hypothetical protein
MSAQSVPIEAPTVRASWLKRWLVPSVPELLFLAILLWLIMFTVSGDSTGMGLLRDSQTGYHIRVGQYVLNHRAVPQTDFLSFTLPDQPFFAWEWLAGIGSAVLYEWGGLRLIVVASALVLALTILAMMRHMAARGANVILAVFLIHLAIGASSLHYLARPHIFTLLFLASAFWIFDRDRQRPTPWLWALIPLTALWANLHGGFFGMLVSAGILTGGSALEVMLGTDRRASFQRTLRWGALTVGCFVASLLNPYGITEHTHLIHFMRETWYLKLTEEYQPVNYLSAPGVYYGIVLIAGVATSIRLLWRLQFPFALLILAWAYASSKSMRHIPIYTMAALPWIAAELSTLWSHWTAGKSVRTIAGTLRKIADDYQVSMSRTTLFVPATALLFLLFSLGIPYPSDFPEAVYPVSLVNHHSDEISHAHVFTTDSWGHYLTYKYPEPYRIFIDGRTDFFGERFSHEYLNTMNGDAGWDETLRRYQVDMALIPPDLGLAGRLYHRTDWEVVERTDSAVLMRRKK